MQIIEATIIEVKVIKKLIGREMIIYAEAFVNKDKTMMVIDLLIYPISNHPFAFVLL
jgi:hypothetical protein